MSSDDSADSESEDETNQQIIELEKNLRESPYYYEGHVQLIKLLRQQGDLDKAREARNFMRKAFPLTEELWLEWLRDEMPLTGLLAESALEVQLLFEAAAEDYLSVAVWVEYARFAVDKMSVMPEGVEFPRDIFERALVACGLHVSQSGLIWEAYLEFEKAMLQSLQDMQMENTDDESLKQQVESQYTRVEKLFKRRLSVTHIGMEEAFLEYQRSFSESAITEESLPAYTRAKKKLEELLPFEQKLVEESASLEGYRSYLGHLISGKGDPLLINTLYQRAVAQHCLDSGLWKEYLQFLDKNFRTAGAVLLPGYRLAVRNCTWECPFWLGLLRAMERNGSSQEEIVATFEKALVDNFSAASDHLSLWLAYCDYHRRKQTASTNNNPSSQPSQQHLLALFERAKKKLFEDFGKQGDPEDVLSRYHANVVGDVAEGRAIWDDVMTRHGAEAAYWMDYVTYLKQRQCGAEECRRVFLKAVNSVTDDPQRVCERLLQLEREEGTLDSFEAALSRTASQMQRIRARREKAAEKEALEKESSKKKRKPEKQQQQKKGGGRGGGGGGRGEESVNGGGRSQQRKRPAVHTFFKGSGEEGEGKGEGEEQVETSSAKRPRIDVGPTPTPPLPTPPVVSSKAKEEEAMETSSSVGGEPPRQVVEEEGEKGEGSEDRMRTAESASKEQCTVFVSNLPSTATKTQLRERFAECGSVEEVRMVKSKRNTFAYVEFSNPAPVSHALSLDRMEFQARKIYVSPFKPKDRQRQVTASADRKSDRMSKSTVYVNNLQRDISEQNLEELFKQCGEVKQVRLVKNLQGRSKGFAYIEYEKESCARAAVATLDSHLLGLKSIGVAMSNPPSSKRGPEGEDPVAVAMGTVRGVASDGVFAIPTFIPRRAKEEGPDMPQVRKSKISLMPRVLAKRGGGGGGGEGGAEKVESAKATTAQNKPLSNADFRRLLTKQ